MKYQNILTDIILFAQLYSFKFASAVWKEKNLIASFLRDFVVSRVPILTHFENV